MRFWTVVRLCGRILAVMTVVTALLGGSVVAFAASAASKPLPPPPPPPPVHQPAPPADSGHCDGDNDADDNNCPNLNISGVWNVTLTAGKFAGKHGSAVLVQQGDHVTGALTDGVHAASADGNNNHNVVSLSGSYQMFGGHWPWSITVYKGSATGQLSADGKTITGNWNDSLGDKGSFVATRN